MELLNNPQYLHKYQPNHHLLVNKFLYHHQHSHEEPLSNLSRRPTSEEGALDLCREGLKEKSRGKVPQTEEDIGTAHRYHPEMVVL